MDLSAFSNTVTVTFQGMLMFTDTDAGSALPCSPCLCRAGCWPCQGTWDSGSAITCPWSPAAALAVPRCAGRAERAPRSPTQGAVMGRRLESSEPPCHSAPCRIMAQVTWNVWKRVPGSSRTFRKRYHVTRVYPAEDEP